MYPASGRAEQIKQIAITGQRALSEETIRTYIKSKEGDTLSEAQVSADIKGLFSSGFFNDVKVEKSYVNGTPGSGVILNYIVDEKPMVVKVIFRGNNQLKEEDLSKLVNIKPHSIYDPAKVAKAKSDIMKEYEKKGQFLSEVTPITEEAGENKINLVFEIKEAPKPSVDEVTFFGNDHLKDSELKRVMSTRGNLPIITSQKYTKEDFERDLYMLKFFYQDKGYLEANLSEGERFLTPDGRHVRTSITIDEGQQYKVAHISIKGDMLTTEEQLKAGLKLKEGDIFRRSLFQQDMQYLTDRYGDEGYALVDIKEGLKTDKEQRTVDITYNIRKGKKVYLEQIYMTGNDLTQDKVIRREMTVQEGQLFSTRELRHSQALVQRLGYFSDVAFIPRPGSAEDRMNVEASVKEKQSGSFSAGAGYSSLESVFFTASYQHQNFLGLGQDVAVQAQVSQRTQNFYFNWDDPYFLDTRWNLGFSVFSTQMQYLQFLRSSQGGSLTFGRRLPHTDNTYLHLTYSYNQASIEDYSKSATIYRMQPAETKTGGLTAAFSRRAVDNYLDPTKGTMANLSFEAAGFGVFGGDNDFTKTELEGRYYQPVYKGMYAAVRARVRLMSFNEGDRLLITERYFMGGIHSMRGYDQGAVSPLFREDNGDKTPIGGNKDMLYTFEYIVPLAPELGMKAVVFMDMGNVYNDSEPMDFANMRYDYGFGLRWSSPMGPLRFEMGFPINPQPGDKPYVFNFSVGTNF